jgi:anti-anti-sigma factor
MPTALAPRRLLINVSGDRTVVRLVGNRVALNHEAALWLRRRLVGLVQQGQHRLAVDLANVPFLTSTAVEAFLGVHRRLKGAGGQLSLYDLKPPVAEVFTVLKLTGVLNVRTSSAGGVRDN